MNRSATVVAVAAITALTAVTSTAATAIAAAPAAAGSAAASTWRITYNDSTLMSDFGSVAAFSGTNVWVEGTVTPNGSPNGQPDIKHWNGTRWTKVSLPATYANARLTAMSASSATNLWIFGQYRDSTGQNPHTFALHTNGSTWSQVGQWLSFNTIDAATVLSPTDVWIFGSVGTWHYNGTSWKQYSLPFSILDASAVRSSDIWAVATSTTTRAELAHWNGTAWKAIPVPAISSSPPGPTLDGIVVNSASDLWAVGGTVTSTGLGVPLALHLTSGVWHQFHPAGPFELGQVIADGTGGVWAAGQAGGFSNNVVLHYSAGTWTSVAMPTVTGKFPSISALGRVPGTTTIYGAGMLVFGGLPETEGLIVLN